jgi:eukaryotic-like serine/threonine-protein kinase
VSGAELTTIPGWRSGPADAPPPGARFGRFVARRTLGHGGTGVVVEAHDPELDRRVAIKVLRPGADAGGHGLEREAQAMARLSHPNVVAVYEVGRAGDQTFIARELVDGETLRAWLGARRPWREVVAMFVAAGRGIAAAHAAGLVHGDVKPDNVLVGRDGRPRVTDFGLVGGGLSGEPFPAAPSATSSGRGAPLGTPAYMSPEHWAGDRIDARSDQFSFCVALWEALWGSRPFAGDDPAAVRAAVRAGRVAAAPARSGAPRWLEPALRRGVATDPEARWPSLDALVDELERRLTAGGRAGRVAAGIAAALAAGVAVAGVTGGAAHAERCPAPDGRLAEVWDDARRVALRDHLTGIDPALGARRFTAAVAPVDLGAAAWRDLHVAACRATRIDGVQSDTLLDLRMRCLDRWLRELDGTIGLLAAAADPAGVDRAVEAVTHLSSVAACEDTATLTASAPPPGPQRAAVDAVLEDVDRIALARKAGRIVSLRAEIDAVVARARTLGHAPTLAVALDELAAVQGASADATAQRATLEELIQVAAAAPDDARLAQAWVRLLAALGTLDQPDHARAVFPAARAAVIRAGEPIGLRSDLRLNQAYAIRHHAPAEARALLDEARAGLLGAGAGGAGSPLADRLVGVTVTLAGLQRAAGELDAAVASYRDAIARSEELYGADHPAVGRAYANLGDTLWALGHDDDAIAAIREAVRMFDARLGDSPALATVLSTLGAMLMQMDDDAAFEAAAPYLDRGVAIARATLPPDDVQRMAIFGDAAMYHHRRGAAADAEALFDEAIAFADRTGTATSQVAVVHYNRAELLADLGRCGDALAGYRRAIDVFEASRGPDTPSLVYPLAGAGACLSRGGDHAAAIAAFDRALAIDAPAGVDGLKLILRYRRGRSLAESRRDVAGGVAEVRAARRAIAERSGADGSALVGEIDAWLRAHGGR